MELHVEKSLLKINKKVRVEREREKDVWHMPYNAHVEYKNLNLQSPSLYRNMSGD